MLWELTWELTCYGIDMGIDMLWELTVGALLQSYDVSDYFQEREKTSQLGLKLSSHESSKHTISNLEEMVKDLKQERDQLREATRGSTHKSEKYKYNNY